MIKQSFPNFNIFAQKYTIDESHRYNQVIGAFQSRSRWINFGQTGVVYKSDDQYFFMPDGMQTVFEVDEQDIFVDTFIYPI